MPESGSLLLCSFCGKSQKQVKKLIAGPHVYICDQCISAANAVIAEPGPTAGTAVRAVAMTRVGDQDGASQCSFCGKNRHQAAAIAGVGDARICNECLALCDEILDEELP